MSKSDNSFSKYFKLVVLLIAVGFITKMIVTNTAAFVNILIVMLGFGAVIMIHEFGHFIVAKLGGIKVEAFSIGFPPTLLGIQKTEKGIRLRILPKSVTVKKDGSGEEGGDSKEAEEVIETATLEHTIKCKYKPGDTEYRIGMIPFGGFVKMLGQEDAGSVEESKDPRSFANKSASLKIAVVAAGVTFNAISAIFIFMAVYLIGLDSPPAMVGDVVPNSPAAVAGIRPGDRFLEINGEDFLDFTSVLAASSLAGEGESVPVTVKHADGTIEELAPIPAEAALAPMPIKTFGIVQANSLTVPQIEEAELIKAIKEKTGFWPGDVIKTVDGAAVTHEWELNEIIRGSLKPSLTLGIERIDNGEKRNVTLDKKLIISCGTGNFADELDLTNISTMVPRLKINDVTYTKKPDTWKKKVLAWWSQKILGHKKPSTDKEKVLMPGDIILSIAEQENPTYAEMRQLTIEHKDKEMAVTVLRKDEKRAEMIEEFLELLETLSPEIAVKAKDILSPYVTIDITVTPHVAPSRADEERVNIGVGVELDIEHAVVATTINSQQGMNALDIPRGAIITAVAGKEVTSFWDVIGAIRNSSEEKITIDYRTADNTGSVELAASDAAGNINARTLLAQGLPVEPLKELIETDSPVTAIKMGAYKVKSFIGQSLTTLRGLFTGNVSPKALSGPLGIISASYSIAEKSIMYYVYFMGIISSILAVMNLLPLPIVDGGVIVLILIEKIKGSPVNTKVQEVIAYAGLAFIGLLFAWLIINDLLTMLHT